MLQGRSASVGLRALLCECGRRGKGYRAGFLSATRRPTTSSSSIPQDLQGGQGHQGGAAAARHAFQRRSQQALRGLRRRRCDRHPRRRQASKWSASSRPGRARKPSPSTRKRRRIYVSDEEGSSLVGHRHGTEHHRAGGADGRRAGGRAGRRRRQDRLRHLGGRRSRARYRCRQRQDRARRRRRHCGRAVLPRRPTARICG